MKNFKIIYWSLYYWAQTAITKCHRLGDWINKNLVSVMKTEIGPLAWWVLIRTLFWFTESWFLTVSSHGRERKVVQERNFSCPLLTSSHSCQIRVLFLTLFNRNYLLKTYNQMQSHWWLGLQQLNLRGHNSVHSSHYWVLNTLLLPYPNSNILLLLMLSLYIVCIYWYCLFILYFGNSNICSCDFWKLLNTTLGVHAIKYMYN